MSDLKTRGAVIGKLFLEKSRSNSIESRRMAPLRRPDKAATKLLTAEVTQDRSDVIDDWATPVFICHGVNLTERGVCHGAEYPRGYSSVLKVTLLSKAYTRDPFLVHLD
jgi:hypothetical protein